MGDDKVVTKKTSLDFDFSDIAGETTQVESVEAVKDILQDPTKKVVEPKKEEAKLQAEKSKEKATGYILAFPVGSNRWKCKDIADCTSEEFVAWAKMYYPTVTAGPERFQSVANKIRAFQQIVGWHQSMMRREVRERIN